MSPVGLPDSTAKVSPKKENFDLQLGPKNMAPLITEPVKNFPAFFLSHAPLEL